MTVKEFRTKLGMTRQEFSDYFGIPIRTIQEWEQGRREPRPYLVTLLERLWKCEKEGK